MESADARRAVTVIISPVDYFALLGSDIGSSWTAGVISPAAGAPPLPGSLNKRSPTRPRKGRGIPIISPRLLSPAVTCAGSELSLGAAEPRSAEPAELSSIALGASASAGAAAEMTPIGVVGPHKSPNDVPPTCAICHWNVYQDPGTCGACDVN